MIARIVAWIRPTAKEIEELAISETSFAGRSSFNPICAGPLAALAILAGVGVAAIPLGLWRVLRGAVAGSDGD